MKNMFFFFELYVLETQYSWQCLCNTVNNVVHIALVLSKQILLLCYLLEVIFLFVLRLNDVAS